MSKPNANGIKGKANRSDLFKFHDEHFKEFIVQWLSSIGIEEMRMLSPDELFNIQPKNIKRWVENSSPEEQLVLLAKTGGEFYIVAGKKGGWKNINSQKSIFQQYYRQGENREKIIDLLVKEKVFVLASQQILIGAYYMHQNCQTDFWRLNRDFIRLYHLWEATKQQIGKKESDDLKMVKFANDMLGEFSFHILRNQGYFANLGLGMQIDLIILVHMMRHNKLDGDNKTKFLTTSQIFASCNDGKYKAMGFGKRLSWLSKNGYLRKMPVAREPRYAIGDRGVMVVLEYLKKMAELVKFYQ